MEQFVVCQVATTENLILIVVVYSATDVDCNRVRDHSSKTLDKWAKERLNTRLIVFRRLSQLILFVSENENVVQFSFKKIIFQKFYR